MNWRVFFATILVTTGIFCIPFFAVADTTTTTPEIQALNQEITTRKDKIKQLEDTIAKYKQNINQKQTEGVSLKNQLSILDNHLAQTQADIDLTTEKIKQTELEIEALQLDIASKEQNIAKQKKVLFSLVQSIHSLDQKNYLEILLSYDSLATFYDELTQAENVYGDIGRTAKAVRLAKEQLENKKTQVEQKRATYLALQQKLQDKKDALFEQSNYKQTLLTQTKSDERRYRTLLETQKEQYQVVESEINSFEAKVRKKLEEQDKIARSGSVLFSWPVASHVINALFHDPDYPFKNVFQHSGVDIKASQGTPVHAAASGYVARARHCATSSCYSYVLIVHTGNLSTLYGHLSNIAIADDAFVTAGDVIGYSGGTPGKVGSGPFVTGQHLHFEVRLNGIPVDPLGYLAQ